MFEPLESPVLSAPLDRSMVQKVEIPLGKFQKLLGNSVLITSEHSLKGSFYEVQAKHSSNI